MTGLWEEVMGTAWVDPTAAPQRRGGREASDAQTTTATAASSGGRNGGGALVPTVDPAARQMLRDELDAIVAHLYGLSRADFEHILGTFPLVFPDTEAGAAKKATLLAAYDQFASEFGGEQ